MANLSLPIDGLLNGSVRRLRGGDGRSDAGTARGTALSAFDAGNFHGKVLFGTLQGGDVEVVKVRGLGLGEVFEKGYLPCTSALSIFRTVRALCDSRGVPLVGGVGTDALREAWNAPWIQNEFRKELGAELVVVPPRIETLSLGTRFLQTNWSGRGCRLPAVVTEVGGGSCKIVYIREDGRVLALADALPIGIVRLGAEATSRGSHDPSMLGCLVSRRLESLVLPRVPFFYLTGGAANSVRRVAMSSVVRRETIDTLIHRVVEIGPPSTLDEDRAEVFLDGLVCIRSIMVALGATMGVVASVPSIARWLLDECLGRHHGNGNGWSARVASRRGELGGCREILGGIHLSNHRGNGHRETTPGDGGEARYALSEAWKRAAARLEVSTYRTC